MAPPVPRGRRTLPVPASIVFEVARDPERLVPGAFIQRSLEDGWFVATDASGQIQYRLRLREMSPPVGLAFDWSFGCPGSYRRTVILRVAISPVDGQSTLIEVTGEGNQLEMSGQFLTSAAHMDRNFLDRLGSPQDDVPMLLGWLEGAALTARPAVQQVFHVQGDLVQGDKIDIRDSVLQNAQVGGGDRRSGP